MCRTISTSPCALAALCTFLYATSALAATASYVGKCTTNTPSYTTIAAAVAATPAGGTVFICPGTYPEQIVVQKPLALQGLLAGNNAGAILTAPAGGLQTNASTHGGVIPIAAQVLAQTSGPVNISNLTLDGATQFINGIGTTEACESDILRIAGIFYQSTPGTISKVETRHQITGGFNGCGYGIYADDPDNTQSTLTVETSDIHDFDATGIYSEQRLVATGNYILAGRAAPQGVIGIVAPRGQITDNFVDLNSAPPFSIGIEHTGNTTSSGNTVTHALWGIYLFGTGSTVRLNRLIDNATGLWIDSTSSGNTIADNIFTAPDASVVNTQTPARANTVGIEFACSASPNVVSGNTFLGLGYGFDQIPKSLAYIPQNAFHAVANVKLVCP